MGKVIMSGIVPQMTAPSTFPAVGSPMSDFTPEQIQEIARTGQGPNYWPVGEMVPITLNGTVSGKTFNNETYCAFIIGFNHNSSREGNNTIHFQFAKSTTGTDFAFVYRHGSSYTTIGGGFCMMQGSGSSDPAWWQNSYMRSTVCPEFLAAMPAEWQNIIVECPKYCYTGSTTYTAYPDKIWLLSEYEVYGAQKEANNYESRWHTQYDYYKAGNSKVKYQHSATNPDQTSTTARWWLRSYADDSTSSAKKFVLVYSENNGVQSIYVGANSYGFAPGFMVA